MPPSLTLDKGVGDRKAELLKYFRSRAAEALASIRESYGEIQYKERAGAINRALIEEKERLVSQVRQVASRGGWGNAEILPIVLLISHCTNVVMLESRNTVWPYEYMSFSRRIGELWEPFCNDCFEFPLRDDVALFVPPLFDDVRKRLTQEIRDFIGGLPITSAQRESLIHYYDQVWSLVTSGEIKLALDLHFTLGRTRFVVDFKSGFSSNEKGNTNRLLLVASVYKNIEPEDYRCLLLVRSKEDQNNHYLQTLKNSGLWELYCGADAYEQIKEFSGFDIQRWLIANVTWRKDFEEETLKYLEESDLFKYLQW